jgi:hypothetical protein
MIDLFFICLLTGLILYTVHGFINLGKQRIDSFGCWVLYCTIFVCIFAIVNLSIHMAM